jgi:ElaB/YqjD/DUF883 family membrane-anchored ribosome-binding protein
MATTQTDTAMKGNSGAYDQTSTVQRLRDQADAVVQRIQPQISAVSTYAREEPTKALLISAATGAALMGLVALMVRSGNSRSDVITSATTRAGTSAMAAIRDAALELADSAQSMASDALHSAQKRLADTFEGARKTATDGADRVRKSAANGADTASDTVSETMADAWKKVRDQAAPVVDKIRPQIDAAAAYAKEDPARVALGLAAAGAIVAGLFALARQSEGDSSSENYPY